MKRFLLLSLIVALVLLVALFVFIGSIAERAIEEGGTTALGVETRLDSADIGILSGEFGLAGLSIANPPGFERPNFLELDHASASASIRALLGDTVEIARVELVGVRLDIERGSDGTNFGTLLERLSSSQEDSSEVESRGKRFVIRELALRDVAVSANPLAGSPATRVGLTLPEIVLHDVGEKRGGATLAELFSTLVEVLLDAAARGGAGLLPRDLLDDLETRLAGLEQLGEHRAEIERALKDFGDVTAEGLEEAGKEASKLLEKGLGDLIKRK
jgi:hypothetical protein